MHVPMSLPSVRVVFGAIATLVVASLLVACGSVSHSQKTLSVVVWEGWEFMRPASEQFEQENPGVTVHVIGSATGQTFFNELPRFLAADRPDITVLQVMPGPYNQLIRAQQLVPINNIWREDGLEKAYSLPTLQAYTAPDGNHYAINVDYFWAPIVWYSKSIFAKLGIDPPPQRMRSQEELFSLAHKLSAAGYEPMTMEIADNGPTFLFSELLESSCGPGAYQNLTSGWQPTVHETTSWTARCVVTALKTMLEYGKEGVFAEGYQSTASDGGAQFAHEKAAMLMAGSEEPTGSAAEHASIPVGWFVLPPVAGGALPELQLFTLDGLGVVRTSRNIPLAEKFLAFIASKRFNSEPAIQHGPEGLPGLEPRGDVSLTSNVPATSQEQRQAQISLGVVNPLSASVPWEGNINDVLIAMLSGNTTPQQAAAQFESLNGQARANPSL